MVTANEDNDIDLDKGVFVCIYDLGDDGKFIDKIKINGVKLIYDLEDVPKCCDKI